MKKIFRITGIILLILIIHSCKKEEVPSLVTIEVTEITANSAKSGGSITSDGGAKVTVSGVCWSTIVEPTVADNKTTDAAVSGTFKSNMIGLEGGTIYYARAYATNETGTGYGSEVTFTTLGDKPETSSQPATDITATTAILNGLINPNYFSTVVTFEYGTSIDYGQIGPAIQNPVTGSSNMPVSIDVMNLLPGTIYHFRVKAVNSFGTTHGNDITFTTLLDLPKIVTSPVSEISCHDAKSGGNISSDGGTQVTARGVCWSTSQNPTILDNKTTNGTGTGSYISEMTGLQDNTTYYLRAYAINIMGIAYGTQLSFKTIQITNVACPVTTGLTCSSTGITIISDSIETAYVVLVWDSVKCCGFDHYHIQYKKTGDLIYSYLQSYTNSIRIDGLSPGTEYKFSVCTVTKWGTPSAYCGEITYTVASSTIPPPTVTGLVAGTGVESVFLFWDECTVSDLDAYNVYRNTVNDSGTSLLIGVIRTTNFVDGGLTGGQIYYYWIKAVDTSGNESINFSIVVYATPRNPIK